MPQALKAAIDQATTSNVNCLPGQVLSHAPPRYLHPGGTKVNVATLAAFAVIFDMPVEVLLMEPGAALRWVLDNRPNRELVEVGATREVRTGNR